MKSFSILIFLTILWSPLHAQKFNAQLALGTNLSEAYLTQTGNSQVGSRLGINVGPGVSVSLNKRWEATMELLYSQNGYYVNFTEVPNLLLDKITLRYIEVPLSFSYRFNIKKQEKEQSYKRSISLGLGYARLFNHKVRAVDGTDVTDDVRFDRENALLFSFGATSYLKKSFALNGSGKLSTFGEWTLALRLLYFIG